MSIYYFLGKCTNGLRYSREILALQSVKFHYHPGDLVSYCNLSEGRDGGRKGVSRGEEGLEEHCEVLGRRGTAPGQA